MPLPSGRAIPLADRAFDANFNRSTDTLYFFQEPALVAATSMYVGSLSIWTPKLAAPVRLSSGYVPHSATTLDHSVTLFFDTPQPDPTAPGRVKLLRTAGCAETSCPVLTLTGDLSLTGTGISLDGRYADYHPVTTAVDGVETHDVFLVSVSEGKATRVARSTIPSRAASLDWDLSTFAPDGSKLATFTTLGGAALQLQVVSTATGAPIPWAAPPAGTTCITAAFSDPATLFVEVLDAEGGLSIHRTTATGESRFVSATQFFLSHTPAGSERYLFFSTTAATALAAQA